MSGRPAPERPGDVVPTPDDFAGWPRHGALGATVSVGPLRVRLARVDARVRESLARWAGAHGIGDAAGCDVHLEAVRSGRRGYLESAPGERLRTAAWREGSGLAFATDLGALLMDEEAGRGIVVLCAMDDAETDRTLQNLLRAAVAWRLAVRGEGLLLHAAAVVEAGAALVLAGPSGAGKSTAARLSAPRAVVADDACILTLGPDGPRVHASPLWAEPGFTGRAGGPGASWPASAVLRLRHAEPGGPAAGLAVDELGAAASGAVLLAHAPFTGPVAAEAAAVADRLARALPVATASFEPVPRLWSLLASWLAARRSASTHGVRT